jgi:putative ABC transport system substrate-binding protein
VPVAVLWSNVNPNSARYWHAAEAAARKRGWTLLKLEIRDAGELEGAFKTARSARAGALLTIASTLLFNRAGQVAELAATNPFRPYMTSARTSRPAA